MRTFVVVALAAAGCSEYRNPDYCEEDRDCKGGKICHLDEHTCELMGDAAPIDEDSGPFIARTVQEVRDPQTPVDTPVELTSVIVTAVDLFGYRNGEFWVQEPGAGFGSGIKVFGAEAADVALLAVGDIVDVTGGKKFYFTSASDHSGRWETEVYPLSTLRVTKTGSTTTPIIVGLDLITIGQTPVAELDAAREKWAGALVRIVDITATGPVGSLTLDPTYQQFPVPFFYVQSLLAPFPGGIDEGTCFSSITGVVEYQYNYNIQPRTTSDVVITACP